MGKHSPYSKDLLFMPLRMDPMDSNGTVDSKETMDIIKDKANSIFVTLFPNIQCQEPFIESEILFVPFIWNTWSNGLMAFNMSGTLDAFRCRPFQFEQSGIVDWIKMKYLTKEQAISEMEQFISPLLNATNTEKPRPRT
jgi:hypothetical protein